MTVIVFNKNRFVKGILTNTFEKMGQTYCSISVNGHNLVTRDYNVFTLDEIISVLNKFEIMPCPVCNHTGTFNPIENPPYKCDDCNGFGYTAIRFE